LNTQKTILVIEDHADTAEVLSLILESEGYRVCGAHTADGAIQLLSGSNTPPIDVVLLDLTLPDMNGDDMILRIRESGTELPPVLIMSAKPATSLESAARSIEAAGIIRKPFDVESLLETIRAALQGQGRPSR
jgi:two-component system, OmpR family, KDP operon response regulator KdpE